MRIKRTNSQDKDFQKLVKLLDKDLAVRDGDEHEFYAQFNKIDLLNNCVVLYLNDEPVGCGAFKPFDSDTIEIKRMYTPPMHRGNGFAVKVLEELEAWAKELSYAYAVLETGIKQPEAIALYTKCQYVKTENYGQYIGVENSVCFRKELD
jgi:GNAT superfamily N-acetyltransferase